MGHFHHVAGPYLLRYAHESGFREDNRRMDNGAQVRRVTQLALGRGPSIDFGGTISGTSKRRKPSPFAYSASFGFPAVCNKPIIAAVVLHRVVEACGFGGLT